MDKTCKSSGSPWVAIFADFSGERVSNTWAICREVGNNLSKDELIPNVKAKGDSFGFQSWGPKGLALHDEPAAYQLVGGVTAHQGEDG